MQKKEHVGMEVGYLNETRTSQNDHAYQDFYIFILRELYLHIIRCHLLTKKLILVHTYSTY